MRYTTVIYEPESTTILKKGDSDLCKRLGCAKLKFDYPRLAG
ncbi:hypothetical protein BN938_2303 [Mucinivorans hirudinis]|uniref:Uncharacterized protein n=1 Tax=Mucinivorans hirudinis TaxID=1433126 RepID=A0A060R9U3_9BACT|nr:hypothetical protein BN938_2303 [Mucinivorans hirudinis]